MHKTALRIKITYTLESHGTTITCQVSSNKLSYRVQLIIGSGYSNEFKCSTIACLVAVVQFSLLQLGTNLKLLYDKICCEHACLPENLKALMVTTGFIPLNLLCG